MSKILKTYKLGEPKYFAGLLEVPMGYAVALSPNIFGGVPVGDGDIEELIRDFPDYEFQSSEVEFGMSENLGGEG